MKKKLKDILIKSPLLHSVAINAYTFKFSDIPKYFQRDKYYSRFGGCWIDRKDYKKILEEKLANKKITENEVSLLEFWVKNGYIIIEKAIPSELVDALNTELNQLNEQKDSKVKITGNFEGAKPYNDELINKNNSVRIVDYYMFSETAKKVLFNEHIVRFLQVIFETQPLLFQSLNFKYGSQQNIHQDTAYVVANEPMKLAATWIALEDITEGSGELIYYEGSHKLPEYLFSNHFKHFNKERDGNEQDTEWASLLHTNSNKMNFPLRKFLPKKGDILIWHADLAHGGSTITTTNTRRSLVGHYCPSNTNPFYFNFLDRKKHKYKESFYSSYHYES